MRIHAIPIMPRSVWLPAHSSAKSIYRRCIVS